ncbi:MAG TPA: hypothetical protein VER33_27075 [Polyangiaceae bacterium]|nr:hypothetical protein [Polyangiaceae bacterium]
MRRLPVLQTTASEDAEAAERPVVYWVCVGGLFALVSFLPLSVLGLWLGTRLAVRFDASAAQSAFLAALPLMAAFGLASWGAGAVVGRFGGRASLGSAALAGAVGGVLTLGLAALGGALQAWNVAAAAASALLGGGASFAALGARFGRSRRPGPGS